MGTCFHQTLDWKIACEDLRDVGWKLSQGEMK